MARSAQWNTMAKKMLIDATHAEETRVVVVDGNKVEEFDFETVNKRQLAGNIYLAKVTRVEPSLQAAFVDYGGNRHGFLAFAEIHPDYYQIPVADRRALLEEERAFARAEEEEENTRSRRRSHQKPKAEDARGDDAVISAAATSPAGMDVVDLGEEGASDLVSDAQAPADQAGAAHDHDTHDHATDDEIESIAEEDVAEEISAPRKPRARKYKIQEVIKVRQIMLVQVVKEERGNKGAALTTYLSLAGRYCVLMPNTARGGGISRKITNAPDRKKLKEIAAEMEVPEGAGLIIRTAGAKRTKPEIKRDYEYLMRMWEQIRELTLRSIAPSQIYEEGNLIKRAIRDLYNREIDEVLVEGEAGYRTAKDFMRMIMPAHARQVMRYDDPTPLFARYQVEGYLGSMFNPVVQLKSGGYIVIGVTEALVAVDVNSGRATKEGSIEETALKTNLEACDEVARQLRLRDLAGLIVIDFIDMEERRNNAAVEKRLKDKLKTDRARIQVGRISGFGLMEMSRQRLRPGMLESTTQPCQHCHGTGLIRSDDSMALQVLRALEEEGTRKRSKEVLLRAPVGIINYLFNQKREHIALIESRYGMSVRMEADPALVSPDYVLEKFKTALRVVPEPSNVISGNASLMGAPVEEEDADLFIEDDLEIEAEVEAEEQAATEAAVEAEAQAPAEAGENSNGKKKRRRRRRRKGGKDAAGTEGQAQGDEEAGDDEGAEDDAADEAVEAPASVQVIEIKSVEAAPVVAEPVVAAPVVEVAEAVVAADAVVADEAPAKPKKPRSRAKKTAEVVEAPVAVEVAEVAQEAPAKPKSRSRAKKAAPVVEAAVVETVAEEAPAKPKSRSRAKKAAPVVEAAAEAPAAAPAPVAAAPAVAEAATPAAEAPKRKGWWAR